MVLLPDEVDLFVVKVGFEGLVRWVFEGLVRQVKVVARFVVYEGVLVGELMVMFVEVGSQILVINMRVKW